jgi:hypothetical protein
VLSHAVLLRTSIRVVFLRGHFNFNRGASRDEGAPYNRKGQAEMKGDSGRQVECSLLNAGQWNWTLGGMVLLLNH